MDDYSKVYKELYEIFKYLPKTEISKLPVGFTKRVKENMDENYKFEVTHIKDFSNQSMLNETRAILAILYRDYWANEEERSKIIKEEKNEINIREQNKKDKNNKYDDIFKTKGRTIEKECQAIVQYNESFLKKILNKIMKIFKK